MIRRKLAALAAALMIGTLMIHCGNPIQYASTETSYWQAHFYCIGRLP